MRKQTLLHTGQKYYCKLEPLRGVNGHHGNSIRTGIIGVDITYQGDMLEKIVRHALRRGIAPAAQLKTTALLLGLQLPAA